MNMKRSSYVAMNMGMVGGCFFSMGMCLCLLPELNAIAPGVVAGCLGIGVLLATVIIWRKMTGRAPIRLSAKVAGTVLLAVGGALLLGFGMCLIMIWGYFVLGIIVGIVGIILPMILIPLVSGLI
jgi:hypothetical protein